ncbi:ADP-dependent glucokinase [Paramuricea clavata]|uniref:ADP-dependent glucokinase n=1 Tax=Paramuricea clavata TaxID=317549 RepID=A0A7D9HCJ3_PARCT|nr:ADP-dependent glucokinase [Paramuricea clavata]
MLRRVREYRAHRFRKKRCLRLLRMNTAQITHALEQDPVTSKKFCGVFPSDKLPQTINRYPCGFVANTDPSSKPGTHWVAFYFPSEEKGEFFDSYGHAPEYYRESFGDFLKSRAWDFNRRKLQSAWSDIYATTPSTVPDCYVKEYTLLVTVPVPQISPQHRPLHRQHIVNPSSY